MNYQNLSYIEKTSLKHFLTLTKDFKGLYHFFMPLTGVPLALVRRELKSCHISRDGTMVYVRVTRIPRLFDEAAQSKYPSFKFMVKLKKDLFLVFGVEEQYYSEIALMMKGKYTQLSDKTKTLLCRESGLVFNKPYQGIKRSSYLLQALYADNEVRSILASVMDIRESDIPLELIGALPDESLLYIDNWVER